MNLRELVLELESRGWSRSPSKRSREEELVVVDAMREGTAFSFHPSGSSTKG